MVTEATRKFWGRKGYGVDASGSLIKKSISQQVAEAKEAAIATEQPQQVKTGSTTITVKPSHRFGWETDEQLIEEAKIKATQTGLQQTVETKEKRYTITPPKAAYPQPSPEQLQKAATRTGRPVQYYNPQTEESFYVAPQQEKAKVDVAAALRAQQPPEQRGLAPQVTMIQQARPPIPQRERLAPSKDILTVYSRPPPSQAPPAIKGVPAWVLQKGTGRMEEAFAKPPWQAGMEEQVSVLKKGAITQRPPYAVPPSTQDFLNRMEDAFAEHPVLGKTITPQLREWQLMARTEEGREEQVEIGKTAAVAGAAVAIGVGTGVGGAVAGASLASALGLGLYPAGAVVGAVGLGTSLAGFLGTHKLVETAMYSKKEKDIRKEELVADMPSILTGQMSEEYRSNIIKNAAYTQFPFLLAPSEISKKAEVSLTALGYTGDVKTAAKYAAKKVQYASAEQYGFAIGSYSALIETAGALMTAGVAETAIAHGWKPAAYGIKAIGQNIILGVPAVAPLGAAEGWFQRFISGIAIGSPAATKWQDVVKQYKIGEPVIQSFTETVPTDTGTLTRLTTTSQQKAATVTFEGLHTSWKDSLKGMGAAVGIHVFGTSLQYAFPPLPQLIAKEGFGAKTAGGIASKTIGRGVSLYGYTADQAEYLADKASEIFQQPVIASMFPQYGKKAMLVFGKKGVHIMTEIPIISETMTDTGGAKPPAFADISSTKVKETFKPFQKSQKTGVPSVSETNIDTALKTSTDISTNVDTNVDTAVRTIIDTGITSNIVTTIDVDIDIPIETTITTEEKTTTDTSSMINTFINIPTMTPQLRGGLPIPFLPPPLGWGGGIGAGARAGKGKKYVSELDLLIGNKLRASPINIGAFGYMGKNIIAMGLPKVAKAAAPKKVKKAKAHKGTKPSVLPKMKAGFAGGMRLW